jgi:hypothetical protein
MPLETGYKVFTGPTEGIFKVLSDPSGNPKQEKEPVKKSPATTTSGNKAGGTAVHTPSDNPAAEIRGKAE